LENLFKQLGDPQEHIREVHVASATFQPYSVKQQEELAEYFFEQMTLL